MVLIACILVPATAWAADGGESYNEPWQQFQNDLYNRGVTTVQFVPVTGVTLDQTSLTLTAGNTGALTATVSPADATDQNVTWVSDKESVATVVYSGTSCTVTAVSAGTATITATTTDGGFTAACAVTVQAPGNTISVTLRVEGPDYTILPETVVQVPDGASNSEALRAAGLTVTESSGFVTAIDGVSGNPFWGFNPYVEALGEGDSIVYAGNGSFNLAQIALPDTAAAGGTFTISVTNADGSPAPGEEIIYYQAGQHKTPTKTGILTDAGGQASLSIAAPGAYYVAAEGSNIVRTKAKPVAIETGAPIHVTGVSLDRTSLTLTVGNTGTLVATVAPADATNKAVTWSSDNETVATVDASGVVTAVAAGTAAITVTTVDGSKTASCAVTVTVGGGGGTPGDTTVRVHMIIKYQNQTLFDRDVVIEKGQTVMDAIFAAAKLDSRVDPRVDWDNLYIPGGYIWSIYGHASPWGEQPDGWIYLVNGYMPNVGAAIYGREDYKLLNNGDVILWRWSYMSPVMGVSLDKASVTISVGDTATLKATFNPAQATDTTLIWTSSNEAVATVDASGTPSGDTSVGAEPDALNNMVGTVTGVSAGTATITATSEDGGFTATCKVTVQAGSGSATTGTNDGITLNKNAATILVGATETLVATVTATGTTDKNLVWTSSNTTVATVDKDGAVTGVAEGTATIKVATEDGTASATCVVTVVLTLPEEQQPAATPAIPTVPAAAPVFSDLPAGHWAKEAIDLLAAGDYLKGYEDGTFRPDQPVTRAEFAAMLVKVIGLPEVSGMAVFSDVYDGEWYYGAVSTCFTYGLIAGYGDRRFGPDEPVTREQVAAMITSALKQKQVAEPDQQSATAQGDEALGRFSDAGEIADWARTAVATMVGKDLIRGYEDSSFRPKSSATRAECAVMLSKLLS